MGSTAHQQLLSAIITSLRADSSDPVNLVDLTGHTNTNDGQRIARWTPPIKARTPYLGVRLDATFPLLYDALTSLKKTMVEFEATAVNELDTIKIADRMEALLKATGNTDLEYFNVSDTNIHNKQTRYVRTELAEFDDDTDVWCASVWAEFHWIDVPCT